MSRRARHIVIVSAGWFFVLLGILGLFLPILQGILFLCIGFILLSRESPRVRLLVMKAGRRWPKFRRALEASRGKAAEWGRKLGVGRARE